MCDMFYYHAWLGFFVNLDRTSLNAFPMFHFVRGDSLHNDRRRHRRLQKELSPQSPDSWIRVHRTPAKGLGARVDANEMPGEH